MAKQFQKILDTQKSHGRILAKSILCKYIFPPQKTTTNKQQHTHHYQTTTLTNKNLLCECVGKKQLGVSKAKRSSGKVLVDGDKISQGVWE